MFLDLIPVDIYGRYSKNVPVVIPVVPVAADPEIPVGIDTNTRAHWYHRAH